MNKQVKTGIAVVAGVAVVALFFIFNGSLQMVQNNALSNQEPQQLVMQEETVGTAE